MRPVCFRGRKRMRIPGHKPLRRSMFSGAVSPPVWNPPQKQAIMGSVQTGGSGVHSMPFHFSAPLPCDSKDLFAAVGSPYLNSRPLKSKLQI